MNRSSNKSSMSRVTGKSPSKYMSGNHLTHIELMSKRRQKKVMKKETISNDQRKKEILEEYSKLNEIGEQTNKGAALVIMELVEEIKGEGMNDKRYLDIMDHLMVIHKGDDKDKEPSVLDSYIATWSRDSYARQKAWAKFDINYNNDLRDYATNTISDIDWFKRVIKSYFKG